MKTLKDELLAAASQYSIDVHGYRTPSAIAGYIEGATQGPPLEKAIEAIDRIESIAVCYPIERVEAQAALLEAIRLIATEALTEIEEARRV